jgi:hypothetical protein
MSRIATVRPVGHIGQRNVRRRVGPERAGHFGLRAQVEKTEARIGPAESRLDRPRIPS